MEKEQEGEVNHDWPIAEDAEGDRARLRGHRAAGCAEHAEFDVASLPPVKACTADEIKNLRLRCRASQAVFAGGRDGRAGQGAAGASVRQTALACCDVPNRSTGPLSQPGPIHGHVPYSP